MFGNKKIKIFGQANLAIETVRMALEVYLGKEIQFRTQDITIGKEVQPKKEGEATIKNFLIEATFSTKDNTYGTDSTMSVSAPVEVTGKKGYWTTGRVHLHVVVGTTSMWLVSHSKYKALTEGLNFPLGVRVTKEDENVWHKGNSAHNALEEPFYKK